MNYIIDLSSTYIWLFAFGVFLKGCWNSWLIWREKNFVLESEKDAFTRLLSLHECAKDFYSEEKLKNALYYERSCSAFNVFQNKIMQRILLIAFALGLVPFIMNFFMDTCNMSFLLSIICSTLSLSFIETIISIPFSYYENFKLESKFGFNNMSLKIFISDLLKGIAISSVFSIIQLSVVVYMLDFLYRTYGQIDWKICIILATLSVFTGLIMEFIEIKIIIPMFNKLSPMDDSPLKTRMEKLMVDFGFNSNGVFIIDASKRSNHSNAYCCGWGKNKSLVLYDTLLKNFSDDEVMAILGHELAHSKLNHLIIDRILNFFGTFLFLWIATFFIYDISLYHAFGFNYVTLENVSAFTLIGFWLFMKIFDAFSWITDGIESWISRMMEYAADKYSCVYNNGNIEPMITSLFKLEAENLGYPFSDKLYEAWNFSHPGFVNRVNALKNLRFCKDCACKFEEMNDCGRII